MKTYRRLWMTGWLFTAVIGTGISTISLPVMGLIMLTLLGSAAGALALKLRQHYKRLLEHDRSAGSAAAVAAHAGVGTLAMLGIAGLSTLLDSFALLLLATMAVTSPWALRKLHHTVGIAGTPAIQSPDSQGHPLPRTGRPTVETMPVSESLYELSDAGLCRAWRSTYFPVREAPDAATLEQLYLFRQACLDEMERRNAHALYAWLNDGARASGNPATFLTSPGEDGENHTGSRRP